MVKRINPTSYRFNNNIVEEMPYFLYEVTIYQIKKDTANLLYSQLYKSNKFLEISKDTIIKKFRNFIIAKYVNIIGVTKEFIEDNHLQLYGQKR